MTPLNRDSKIFYLLNLLTNRFPSDNTIQKNYIRLNIGLTSNETSITTFSIKDNYLNFHLSRMKLDKVFYKNNNPLKEDAYNIFRKEEYERIWKFIIANKPTWMTDETFSQLILKHGVVTDGW